MVAPLPGREGVGDRKMGIRTNQTLRVVTVPLIHRAWRQASQGLELRSQSGGDGSEIQRMRKRYRQREGEKASD